MNSNIYVYVVCVVYVVNVVYLVNVAKVRFTRFTRFTLYTPGGLVNLGVNVGFEVLYRAVYWLSACPSAGYVSFLFNPERGRDAAGPRKLARFLHEKGVEKGCKTIQNGLIRLRDNYHKNTYRNHTYDLPLNRNHNRNFQMINDLQGGFEKGLVTCNVQG